MLGLGNSLSRGGVLSGLSNNYSLACDGSEDYVAAGNDSSLQMGTDDFSIFAWVKRSAVDAHHTIYGYGDSDKPRYYLRIKNNNKLQIYLVAASLTLDLAGSADIDTGWHFVGFTWDRSEDDGFQFYVDGSADGSGQDGNNVVSTSLSHASVGAKLGVRPNLSSGFNGNLDEISVWDTVLSSSSVSALYNSGVPTDLQADANASNLVAWWRFEEGSGTSAEDSSDNSNTGTLTNDASYSTTVPT